MKDKIRYLVVGIAWALSVILIICLIPGAHQDEVTPITEEVCDCEPTVIWETKTEYIEVPVECERQHWNPYYQSVIDNMTEEEYHLVAKIVHLESNNQSIVGQRAVAEVIFNRVLSNKFPNTIKGVLSQGNPTQFSTWPRVHKAQPNEKNYEAVDAALSATVPILPADCLYFATYHANGTYYEKIGDHIFCRG